MKKQMMIAGMLLSTATAHAAVVNVPAICKTVANYAAQSQDLYFSDGSFSDRHNPASITLRADFRKFPITGMKDLGNCDEGAPGLKEAWCKVAGGSPNVYELEFNKVENGTSMPVSKVIVTYNRGGCWVDEVEIK